VNSRFVSAIVPILLLLAGCATPPKQIPPEQHQAVLEEGGTVVLVQTHRNIHAPRPPYVTRLAGLTPEIESAAFDLDSLTPNSSGSVKLDSFKPVSAVPVTLDPGSAADGWRAFLLDPGSYVVDFRIRGPGRGEKLSAVVIVPENRRLLYAGSFEFHIDTEKSMFSSSVKGYSSTPVKIKSRLDEAVRVASQALPEYGRPEELTAVLYGSPLRSEYHTSVYPMVIDAYDPGRWISPDLTAAWASRLASQGAAIAAGDGSGLIFAPVGALLGGAIGGVYSEAQEKSWESEFQELAETLEDYDGTRRLQLELQTLLKDGGPVRVTEVSELWEAERSVPGATLSEANLELLPLFLGFNTLGPNTLATAMVVRVRFRPANHETPVFDQVLVYTQNQESIPFFMIPVPSVGRPFSFKRLREADAAEFLRQELNTAIRYVSDHIVRDLLVGGRGAPAQRPGN
jgi:hypothetical protein